MPYRDPIKRAMVKRLAIAASKRTRAVKKVYADLERYWQTTHGFTPDEDSISYNLRNKSTDALADEIRTILTMLIAMRVKPNINPLDWLTPEELDRAIFARKHKIYGVIEHPQYPKGEPPR